MLIFLVHSFPISKLLFQQMTCLSTSSICLINKLNIKGKQNKAFLAQHQLSQASERKVEMCFGSI